MRISIRLLLPIIAVYFTLISTPLHGAYTLQGKNCMDGIKIGYNEGEFTECGQIAEKSIGRLNLKHRNIRAMNIRNTAINNSRWEEVQMENANGRESTWKETQITNSSFNDTDFRGAKFFEFLCQKCNFRSVNFSVPGLLVINLWIVIFKNQISPMPFCSRMFLLM